MKIEYQKIKDNLGTVKGIGYIIFFPYALLTPVLMGIPYVWLGLSIFMVLGSIFYFIIAPIVIESWDSKGLRHVFRPYILGTMVSFGVLMFYMRMYFYYK